MPCRRENCKPALCRAVPFRKAHNIGKKICIFQKDFQASTQKETGSQEDDREKTGGQENGDCKEGRCEDDKDDGKEARSQKGSRHKSRKEKSLIHFT